MVGKFYRDILGLNEVRKPKNFVNWGGCWFQNGFVVIYLGGDKDFRPVVKVHPRLLVHRLHLELACLELT